MTSLNWSMVQHVINTVGSVRKEEWSSL
jgi:hypothetical protein